MENFGTSVMVILGLLVRIGIPVAVTIFVVGWLRHLDAHWQEQADLELTALGVKYRMPANRGCWKINACSSESTAGCKAYAHPEMPCWQVFRGQNGALQEKCIGCKVFKEAPVPTTA